MRYLLDTDTVIALVRGLKSRQRAKRDSARALMQRCQQAEGEGHSVALSAITVSELEHGACKSLRYDDEIAAVRKVLVPFELLQYDAIDCPIEYGRLRHELEFRGDSIGAMDLLIAAHALAVSATMVTNNIAHFGRVPNLQVMSWP